jgi:hypothetical protein
MFQNHVVIPIPSNIPVPEADMHNAASREGRKRRRWSSPIPPRPRRRRWRSHSPPTSSTRTNDQPEQTSSKAPKKARKACKKWIILRSTQCGECGCQKSFKLGYVHDEAGSDQCGKCKQPVKWVHWCCRGGCSELEL